MSCVVLIYTVQALLLPPVNGNISMLLLKSVIDQLYW